MTDWPEPSSSSPTPWSTTSTWSMLVDRCMELLDVSATGLMLADSHDQLRVMASSAEDITLLELFQL